MKRKRIQLTGTEGVFDFISSSVAYADLYVLVLLYVLSCYYILPGTNLDLKKPKSNRPKTSIYSVYVSSWKCVLRVKVYCFLHVGMHSFKCTHTLNVHILYSIKHVCKITTLQWKLRTMIKIPPRDKPKQSLCQYFIFSQNIKN